MYPSLSLTINVSFAHSPGRHVNTFEKSRRRRRRPLRAASQSERCSPLDALCKGRHSKVKTRYNWKSSDTDKVVTFSPEFAFKIWVKHRQESDLCFCTLFEAHSFCSNSVSTRTTVATLLRTFCLEWTVGQLFSRELKNWQMQCKSRLDQRWNSDRAFSPVETQTLLMTIVLQGLSKPLYCTDSCY